MAKKSPRFFSLICLLLVVLMLAACGDGTGSSSTPGASSTSSPVSTPPADISAGLDTTRLPTHKGWYNTYPFGQSPYESIDGNMPPQLVIPTDQARQVADYLQNYYWLLGNALEDFSAPGTAPITGAITTAMWHTSPLVYSFTYDDENGDMMIPGHPDHILSEALKRNRRQGYSLSEIWYADEVDFTMQLLFGPSATGAHGRYLPLFESSDFFDYLPEGFIVKYGDAGNRGISPQITLLEQTADGGFVCEAVLCNLDETLGHPPEYPPTVTADNFAEATAGNGKYRYTFAPGTLSEYPILVAFEVLREVDYS